MKPHKRSKRFYNDPHDRIRDRFWHMLKEWWFYAKRRLGKQKKRPFFEPAFNLESWMCRDMPRASSETPVITWIGHATFLIQIDGMNILTDPVFGNLEKMPVLFPRRVPAPFGIDKLPKIDAIVISHSHQDHMDRPTLLALKKDQPHIFVPHGKKQWFVRHGFKHVTELEWWQSESVALKWFETKPSVSPHHERQKDPARPEERAMASVSKDAGAIKFTFLPAVHWTGREIFDINKSLWGSWMIETQNKKIYFAGDTAYGKHFEKIKTAFGPIDIAMMPIAPNEPHHFINHVHLNAHDAVQAFIKLGAQHFIPMHWGTFESGLDTFLDPIELVQKAWQEYIQDRACTLHIVKFGEQREF